MTENLLCLNSIRDDERLPAKIPSWQTTVANFLLNEDLFKNNAYSERFSNFPLSNPQKRVCHVPALAKEVKITEARRLVRQEKFQHLSKEKQNRVIKHEILQIKESLLNRRTLQKMELETVDEFSALQRRRREIRENSLRSKTAFQGYPRVYRSNDFIISVNLEKKCKRSKINAVELENKEMISEVTEPSIECYKIKGREICPETPLTNKCEKHQRNLSHTILIDNVEKAARSIRSKQDSYRSEINIQSGRMIEIANDKKIELIRRHFDKRMMKITFSKWKQYVDDRRNKMEEEKLWKEKIELFMKRLNNFSKKQREDMLKVSTATKSLRTKTAPASTNYKSMKHHCRSTLPNDRESDKELKYISQEVAQSNFETQEKLRAKSVLSLDPSLRGRAKLIRVFNSIVAKKDVVESQNILEFPEPRILLEMNLKQEERKKRLEELKERKRILEDEKDRLAREKLQRQLREEEEEKRRKLQEFREKVRKERIEQEKRKQECLRLKSLMSKAAYYYSKKLLTKYGFYPWLEIVKIRRKQTLQAQMQDERRQKRLVLEIWMSGITLIREEKERRALLFWRAKILQNFLSAWAGFVVERAMQMKVAEDWHDFSVTRRYLRKWEAYVSIEQIQLEDKWDIAVQHYKRKEARKHLKQWMLLPQVMYLEREKEERKQEWRRTVMQVIPDFTPCESICRSIDFIP